jgi:transposase
MFVLTVKDKDRFQKSRDIGCYIGLRPRRSERAESTAITNHQGRRPLSEDDAGARSALHHQPPRTRYRSETLGLRLAERGGKRGKKKAVVAVARKLGILLHPLWITGEVYEPLRNQNLRKEQKKAV